MFREGRLSEQTSGLGKREWGHRAQGKIREISVKTYGTLSLDFGNQLKKMTGAMPFPQSVVVRGTCAGAGARAQQHVS